MTENPKSDNVYKNLIISSGATGIAEFATLPICTVKTNFQNIKDMKARPSILQVAKTIYTHRGISGFYAASYPAITGQMFSTASKYTMYRYFDTNPAYPIKNKFVNGFTAGVISSIFTHPMDVIKVHKQMTQWSQFLEDFRVNLLYRGYSKTFAKIAVSSTIFFPLYDTVKMKMIKMEGNAAASTITASAISGSIACVIMHPIDYLKTRHMAGLQLYSGMNPRTYYRGLMLNMMRIIPHFVITMQCIEFMKNA